MRPFTQLTAPACPLGLSNVDTDQLIPARFMKEPRSVGYGQFLLYDLRFDATQQPVADFALNQPEAEHQQILVARRNFGAGSSREAAVYALVDFGFRCVIAPSFGDIFSSNAVNNGLLPAVVSEEDCERLLSAMHQKTSPISVDLEQQRIECNAVRIPFAINPVWRTRLLNGWDDIDLTEGYRTEIDRFIHHYRQAYPWTEQQSQGADASIERVNQ
ncbi:MAG: 3-isopropylmalate dehydratase small subunit [Saccharospirillum sp.]|nr:3-isopropylmalate dehydratase small subunit [Saccharospirillum sp.]